ncbi:MAG: GNAT family N-acetyltransferase [Gemmatimonadales bacterium]|nr:GNAT family N-acetyltransferase [Gemmatimonadales bacterium]
MHLVTPAIEHLPSYIAALERGWSPDTRRPEAAPEELERIHADPARFLAEQDDMRANGPPIHLPDGTEVPRLPGYRRWLWDGEFAGVISFRWQPGGETLPDYCLGHVGYTVVPWRQGRGYATAALRRFLAEMPALGMKYIELTCNTDNAASRRVIEVNGGVLVERFSPPHVVGGGDSYRFRIALTR